MPFSSRAVSISTKVALPSMVTSVRVGSALPSVVHLPIAGCHALIEQNGPIMAHTFAGGASTSMLFVTEAAEAAPALMLKSAAEAIVVLISHKFHSPDCPLQACSRRRAPDLIASPIRAGGGLLGPLAAFSQPSF